MKTTKHEIKKSLSVFLKQQGFKQKKNYYYKIYDETACVIAIDVPSEILYLTACVIPLYIPYRGYIEYTYGNRIQTLNISAIGDVNTWIDRTAVALTNMIDPFFQEISFIGDFSNLKEVIPKWHNKKLLFCSEEQLLRWMVYKALRSKEYKNAELAIDQFLSVLDQVNIYGEQVRTSYKQEMKHLRELLNNRVYHEIQEELNNNIMKNREMLFQ
ncbi:MAG: hypothetical protein IJ744_10260 [Lachnospiraceae bacterium]|nr:hypothetical protein [Lachnospiraceae bacterium]